MGPEPKPTRDNQLVLYNVPTSLTVPEAQDSVRKAILEARGRIRDRQASGLVEHGLKVAPTSAPQPALAAEVPPPSFDPDAMDID
jgi:hypothetical protein